jgi:Secretory lipase
MGYPIEYRSYPGQDHDPVMMKSTPDQIRWIKDRFEGKPATSNCNALPG